MSKASAKHPFLPMFVGDFMAATAEWEGEEQALYSLLLMHQWALGHLPVEVTKLARLARWDIRNFERYWPTVASKFEAREVPGFGPRLLNPRLEDHRAKSQAISEKRSHIGKLGAEAKWQNDSNCHAGTVANANAGDGKSQNFANGKRNAIHPIPSHPIPDSESRSSQAPKVGSPSKGQEPTHTSGLQEGSPEMGPDPHEVLQLVKSAYPPGTFGQQNWILAEREIGRRLEEGFASEELVGAAAKYCKQQTAKGSAGTEFIRSPEKFYGQGFWRGPFPLPAAAQPSAPKRMRTAQEIAEALDPNNTALSGP